PGLRALRGEELPAQGGSRVAAPGGGKNAGGEGVGNRVAVGVEVGVAPKVGIDMDARDRICAALDFATWSAAEPFARAVAPEVGMLKVGLELFAAEGPAAVRAAAALGRTVFLDLK